MGAGIASFPVALCMLHVLEVLMSMQNKPGSSALDLAKRLVHASSKFESTWTLAQTRDLTCLLAISLTAAESADSLPTKAE